MRNTLYLSIILALSPGSMPLAFAAAADGLEARVSTPIAAQPLARALEQLSRSSRQAPMAMHGRCGGAVPACWPTVVDGNVIAIDPAPVRNAPNPAHRSRARPRRWWRRPWTR